MRDESDDRKKDRAENVRNAMAIVAVEASKVASKGMKYAKEGLDVAGKGALVAKNQIIKVASDVVKNGKEAQMAALKFVDKKKNARFLSTKLQSFEDGIKKGKLETVEYVKKYANFCLAATAVSFYFAQCDGEISEKEWLEIRFDLDSIAKNKDLPIEIKNKLAEISNSKSLSFEEVAGYLDGVGIDTLYEFQKDIDEIIFADGVVNDSEKEAKSAFDDYLKKRVEAKIDE